MGGRPDDLSAVLTRTRYFGRARQDIIHRPQSQAVFDPAKLAGRRIIEEDFPAISGASLTRRPYPLARNCLSWCGPNPRRTNLFHRLFFDWEDTNIRSSTSPVMSPFEGAPWPNFPCIRRTSQRRSIVQITHRDCAPIRHHLSAVILFKGVASFAHSPMSGVVRACRCFRINRSSFGAFTPTPPIARPAPSTASQHPRPSQGAPRT